MILSMPFPGSSSKKTGQTKGENVSLWEKNSSGDGQQTEENIVQEPVQAASAKPAQDYEKELERSFRTINEGDIVSGGSDQSAFKVSGRSGKSRRNGSFKFFR